MSTRLVAVLAAAAAAATLGSIAWAMIPDASGVFHACVKPNGQVRIIDTEAGKTCDTSEEPVSWSQIGPAGPQGPPGPAGTALAYGHVAADGSLAHAKNITSVATSVTGAYCFDLAVAAVNIQVQMDRASTGDDVRVDGVAQIPAPPPVFDDIPCDATHSDAFVNVLRDIGGGNAPEAHAFYVLFN